MTKVKKERVLTGQISLLCRALKPMFGHISAESNNALHRIEDWPIKTYSSLTYVILSLKRILLDSVQPIHGVINTKQADLKHRA